MRIDGISKAQLDKYEQNEVVLLPMQILQVLEHDQTPTEIIIGNGLPIAQCIRVKTAEWNAAALVTESNTDSLIALVESLAIQGFISYRGIWDSVTEYDIGNFVSHEGSTWKALSTNTNQEPPSDPEDTDTYWEIVAAKGATGDAATLTLGTIATGEPGSDVIITNSGTDTEAILDITIPRGNAGVNGINYYAAGFSQTVDVGDDIPDGGWILDDPIVSDVTVTLITAKILRGSGTGVCLMRLKSDDATVIWGPTQIDEGVTTSAIVDIDIVAGKQLIIELNFVEGIESFYSSVKGTQA